MWHAAVALGREMSMQNYLQKEKPFECDETDILEVPNRVLVGCGWLRDSIRISKRMKAQRDIISTLCVCYSRMVDVHSAAGCRRTPTWSLRGVGSEGGGYVEN
jgi:hypothetical protein